MSEKPQFPYEEIYITPFTSRRHIDENGVATYEPIERNLQPTGVRLLDGFAAQIAFGNGSRNAYCKRMGITTTQLNHLLQLLTGVGTSDFRTYFSLRLVDDLLRYTDLEISEIASRSGIGSTVNLFYIFRRVYDCSPTDRRLMLRKKGDLNRYKL